MVTTWVTDIPGLHPWLALLRDGVILNLNGEARAAEILTTYQRAQADAAEAARLARMTPRERRYMTVP